MRQRIALTLCVVAGLLAGCTDGSPPAVTASDLDPGVPVPADAFAITVVRDVDGDTLVARRDGDPKEFRIRLVGIDTPESVKPDTPVACYGHEASSLTAGITKGPGIKAAYEKERQDQYGRDLLDVWLGDGRWLQGLLVSSGVARAYPFRPNTVYAQQLSDLQRKAHDNRAGLWGACNLYDAFPQLKPKG